MQNVVCFENQLISDELPVFSNIDRDWHFVNEVKIFRDEKIKDFEHFLINKDIEKKNKSKIFEFTDKNSLKVEHFFIDFTVFQLGQKLKNFTESENGGVYSEFKMNGLSLARILACKSGDLNFYKQESI